MNFRRFEHLQFDGVFSNYRPKSDLPDFQKFNLVYGFNGTGKTTLSRIFESFARRSGDPLLPKGGSAKVVLADGTKADFESLPTAVSERIAVFNGDFVDRNLSWSSGTAHPVFYIGEEQVGIADELSKRQAEEAVARQAAESDAKLARAAARNFASIRTDGGRLISEQIYRGRTYNARDLDQDYASLSIEPSMLVGEDERSGLRGLIAADAPLPKLELPQGPPDIASIISRATSVANLNVGAVAIDALMEHRDMIQWVTQGAQYHVDHGLQNCLFCNQAISSDRMLLLASLINDQWNKAEKQADAVIVDLEGAHGWIEGLGGLPSDVQISADLRVDYKAILLALADNAGVLREEISTSLSALFTKKINLSSTNIVSELSDRAPVAYEELLANWSRLLAIFGAHNDAFEQFGARQRNAIDRLKLHYLAVGHAAYAGAADAAASAGATATSSQKKFDELQAKIADLKSKLLKHHLACPPINSLIQSYLGHGELEIQAVAEGYEIRRRGQRVEGDLSEGEKTAIALCYFLCRLTSEGRKMGDRIVVFDDPISSLDTKALNYAFSLIKRQITPCAQVFVFTHNIHFMNEVKKWLKGRVSAKVAAGKPIDAALFVLECFEDAEGLRKSALRGMPAVLLNFDSEYHYLFWQLRAASEQRADAPHIYLMPNITRKLLETFLAFRLPNSAGFGAKIEQALAKVDPGEAARVRALERLVQVESHGDSLDDLVALPAVTVEEIQAGLKAAFFLMKKLDEVHFEEMWKRCEAA